MAWRRNDLREGQWWDEISSAAVNARSRRIVMIGSRLLTYEDEMGRTFTIRIDSFLRWCRMNAELAEP